MAIAKGSTTTASTAAIGNAAHGEIKRSTASHPDRIFDDPTLQYKVILLGDGATGKSALIRGLGGEPFARSYAPTVGADFVVRRVPLPGGHLHSSPTSPASLVSPHANAIDLLLATATDQPAEPEHGVSLALWDIGGHRIGSRMMTNYIHGAHAVLLCYDITNAHSFQNLDDWLLLVRRTFTTTSPHNQPYIGLVALKMDLQHLRTVRADRHQSFHETNHLQGSFFVSSKSGAGVRFSLSSVALSLAKPLLPAADAAAIAALRTTTIGGTEVIGDDTAGAASRVIAQPLTNNTNNNRGGGGGGGAAAAAQAKSHARLSAVSPRRIQGADDDDENHPTKCLIM